MPVSNWSTTAASNGSTLGIDIAENCDAANINNAQREMMAQLKTKFDAIDTTIAGLSVDPTLTALGGLTTAANEMIYATGVDTFAMTTLSSFARTLLDDGDAATARATLGAIGVTASSFANPGYVKFSISGTTFIIQWGSATVNANGSTTINYPTAFSSFSIPVLSAIAAADTNSQDNPAAVQSASTASFSVFSASDFSATGYWIAVGV